MLASISFTAVIAALSFSGSRERTTTYRGADVDLVRFMMDHRERLVLKPNDDYGGKGITLGWTVDGSAWEAAVKAALATPHIVQERVEIPAEPLRSASRAAGSSRRREPAWPPPPRRAPVSAAGRQSRRRMTPMSLPWIRTSS